MEKDSGQDSPKEERFGIVVQDPSHFQEKGSDRNQRSKVVDPKADAQSVVVA